MSKASAGKSRKTTAPFPRGAFPQASVLTGAAHLGRAAYAPRQAADYGSDKAVVQALFNQLGGVKRAQAVLGLGSSETYLLGAADQPDELASYRQIRQMTAAGGHAAAEDLAHLAGGIFMAMPKGEGLLAGLTAEMVRQAGETFALLMQAQLDGRVTPDEAPACLESLDLLQRYISASRAHLLRKLGAVPPAETGEG
jgi:hypothetical protein